MNTPRVRTFLSLLMLMAGTIALPETVFAAEEGSKWGFWLDIGKLFNLVLVLAVLVWVARKPLANFFSGRTQAIRDQLAEAQKARLEAENKLAEIESRMSQLDNEIHELRAAGDKEAQEEYER